jgi:hypothetical protein
MKLVTQEDNGIGLEFVDRSKDQVNKALAIIQVPNPGMNITNNEST